jgi:hypothetical protein
MKAKRGEIQKRSYFVYALIIVAIIISICMTIQRIVRWKDISDLTDIVAEQCEISPQRIEAPRFYSDDGIDYFSGEIYSPQINVHCKYLDPIGITPTWRCTCEESQDLPVFAE